MSQNDDNVSISKLMLALLSACVAFQLNCSMLSPALVTIASELKSNDVDVGLSQTAFFTSAALFSLFIPRLSDIIGRKKIMIWMLLIMVIGTIISAVSVNVEMLYVGRIVQGVCGPIVAVCLMMIRSQITDLKKCGLLMGIITAVNGGIAGIDAILGGVMAQHLGFRSIFWFIGIISIISSWLVIKFSKETRPSPNIKMDWVGTVLLVVSTGSILIALNELSNIKNTSWYSVFSMIGIAIFSFIGFWKAGKNSNHPLVPIQYLKLKSTWSLLLTTVLTMCGVFAVINGLIMSYVQNKEVGFGLSPDWAGFILLTPYALTGWLIGPLSGRFAPVLGYANVLRIGLMGSVISIAIINYIGLHSLPILIGAVIAAGAVYAGMANIMLNALGIVLSSDENAGILPGLNAGAFNLGAGLSFAILPAIQLIAEKGGSATVAGYSAGINTGLFITALALLSSFLIPRPANAEVRK
ncbi:multidrug ABC transporter [Tatumella morbirosei]|uniref:Multidrug ABC transporter n=1 Tax=Tatumella morbirosei TaxID=642227 RepID=A0A095VJN9_9GAMM|nr:MFS transporter [Tatumella morbirosei]KGD74860.1 multidrug ABC transporter [Tatumella morbirosei]